VSRETAVLFQKLAGVVCLAVSVASGGLAVLGLLSGEVSLVTKSASVVFRASTDPTGYWIMEAIYSFGAVLMLGLGIFALRADRPPKNGAGSSLES
jgi:hypothetical protein